MKIICLSEGAFLRLLAPICTIVFILVPFTIYYEVVENNPEANQKEKVYQLWSILSTIYGTAISICIYRVCVRKCPDKNKLQYHKIMFPLNLSLDLFMITLICLSNSYFWFKDGLINVEWFRIFHYYTLEIRYIRVIYSHLYTYNKMFCKVYHYCLMCFKYMFVFLLIMNCFSVIVFITRLYELKGLPPMYTTTYSSISNLSTKDGDGQNMTYSFEDNQTYTLHSTTFLRVKYVDETSEVFSKLPKNESKDGCQCVSKYVHIDDFPEADNVIFNSTCPHESRSFNVLSIGDCKKIFFTPLNLHWHDQHTLIFGPFNENFGMEYLGSFFFNNTLSKESHIPSKMEVNNVENKKSILQFKRTIYNNFSVKSSKLNTSKVAISLRSILKLKFSCRMEISLTIIALDIGFLIPKINSFDLFSYLRILKLKHIPRPSKIPEDTIGAFHILVDNWFIFLLECIRNSCIGDLLNRSTIYNLICIQCIYEQLIELHYGLSIAILVVIWCFITLITKMFYKLADLNTHLSESLDVRIKQELQKKFDSKDKHEYITILSSDTNDDFVENTILQPLNQTRNKVLSRKDFLGKFIECTCFKMYHELSKISKKYVIVISNDFFRDGLCTYIYLGLLVLEGVKSKTIDKKDILIIQIENINTESEYMFYLSDMKTIDFTKNSLSDNIDKMRKWAMAENLNLNSENYTYTTLYA